MDLFLRYSSVAFLLFMLARAAASSAHLTSLNNIADIFGQKPYESQDHCTQHGCFPLYYIIGSPKSGTTSLWEAFRIESTRTDYPNKGTPCVATRKELRFWNKNSDVFSERKTNRYRSFFPQTHRCNTGAYLEATPTYLG